MTTSDTRPDGTGGQDQSPIAVGQLVITWYDAKPVKYGGTASRGFTELSFRALDSGPAVRKCDPDRVAPADTPIPTRDARVTVEQRPRSERPPGAPGNWRLTLPGQLPSWHNTKRDGTADGLRRVAILDWHAAQATQAELPGAGPDDKRRITAARLQPVPALGPGIPSGQNAVIATVEDDTDVELFSYYTDDLQFSPAEFEGLTVEQGRGLFARRDTEYLQS